jgi:hypothetical protein
MVGVSFLGESKYLLWLNVAALVISLIVLYRRTRHASYIPVLIGALAALLILAGKFLLSSNTTAWLGAATLLAVFIGSRPKTKPIGCTACVGSTSLELVNHGIEES